MANQLFFSLLPDEETRAALCAQTKTVLVRYPPGGRPITPESLHLTLVFLGDDLKPDQEAAARAAASGVQLAPFEFSLNVAYSSKGANAWCIGSRENSTELAELRRQLKERITAARVITDAKRFSPHLTVLRNAPHILPPTRIKPIAWSASYFALIRSVSSEGSSTYEVVDRWELSKPDPEMEQIQLF